MEIEYGAEVVDSKGVLLGKIDYLLRDAYTGEITKFKVSTPLAEADLFFSVGDVSEATADKVTLKVPFGGRAADKGKKSTEVAFGAEVVDSQGTVIGKIDYIMRDSFTGEITKFKVETQLSEEDLFFSIEDVAEANASKVKLKIAIDKGKSRAG